jgi:hypothetical protein
MSHYEAIIGTDYQDAEYVEEAVAEAMYHLSPLHMARPPIDVNVYGDDDTSQFIGIGVVFETDASIEQIEDCGAEVVSEVSIEMMA